MASIQPAQRPPSRASQSPTCGLATASLALGVVGLCTCVLGPLLGIPAVICGHLGLSRINASQGTIGGRGLAIGGLVTGYLSLAMVFVLAVPAALLLPAVASAREKARQVSCSSNLKQIGLGVMMYASDYDGVQPPTLESIMPYINSEQVFRCPSVGATTGGGFHSDYEYLGAGMRQAEVAQPAQTVIVVESAVHHRNGMNMLFADGHVQFVAIAAGQDWRGAAAAQGLVIPPQ